MPNKVQNINWISKQPENFSSGNFLFDETVKQSKKNTQFILDIKKEEIKIFRHNIGGITNKFSAKIDKIFGLKLIDRINLLNELDFPKLPELNEKNISIIELKNEFLKNFKEFNDKFKEFLSNKNSIDIIGKENLDLLKFQFEGYKFLINQELDIDDENKTKSLETILDKNLKYFDFSNDIKINANNLGLLDNYTVDFNFGALIRNLFKNIEEHAFKKLDKELNKFVEISKKNKKVNVNVYLKKDTVVISIADNGKGIPEDFIDKVFVDGKTTKYHKKGHGLALAHYKNELEKIGGDLRVKSEKNKGTTFFIEIPKK